MKFGLNYKITIQTAPTAGPTQPNSEFGNAIVIEPGLTIGFNIHRSVMATINGMTLQIYNLSASKRNIIYQDRFDTRRYKIIVEMGYLNQNLSTIFIGDIYEANSTREGSNIVTTIDARDGNFDTNQTMVNTTFAKGKTLNDILKFLAAQFPNVKIGSISDNTLGSGDVLSRATVLEGNVYEQIKKYALASGTNNVWIDLEVINITGLNEVIINANLSLIDASTGLIKTPRRDQSYLTVTTLLEPRVIMGQILELKSSVMPQYNGNYKVVGVTHKGTISGAVESKCESTFNLIGNQLLGGFSAV